MGGDELRSLVTCRRAGGQVVMREAFSVGGWGADAGAGWIVWGGRDEGGCGRSGWEAEEGWKVEGSYSPSSRSGGGPCWGGREGGSCGGA